MTTMTETDIDRIEDGLDTLFAAARRQSQDLPPELEARILADAARIGTMREVRPSLVQRLRQIWDMLGGWPAATGLATACAAGVWIGLAPPSFLPDPVAMVLGDQVVLDQIDSDPFATLLEEGA
jgi:hypothetical protein